MSVCADLTDHSSIVLDDLWLVLVTLIGISLLRVCGFNIEHASVEGALPPFVGNWTSFLQ